MLLLWLVTRLVVVEQTRTIMGHATMNKEMGQNVNVSIRGVSSLVLVNNKKYRYYRFELNINTYFHYNNNHASGPEIRSEFTSDSYRNFCLGKHSTLLRFTTKFYFHNPYEYHVHNRYNLNSNHLKYYFSWYVCYIRDKC